MNGPFRAARNRLDPGSSRENPVILPASFAYGDRIVIFMEDGLHFPANFESVGLINFDQGGIEAKSMELLKELVGVGLVKITRAA